MKKYFSKYKNHFSKYKKSLFEHKFSLDKSKKPYFESATIPRKNGTYGFIEIYNHISFEEIRLI